MSYTGPSFDAMMPYLVQALKNLGGSGTVDEIDQQTFALLQLSDDVLLCLHGSGNLTEAEYRLTWTRTFLKKAGIIDNSTRGVWSLTQYGKELPSIDPQDVVRRVRAMAALAAPPASSDDGIAENDGIDVPEEIQSWRDKLKNVLYNLQPAAFERLTQRVLRESGFTKVEVTGRTGDGGIDGVGVIKLGGMLSFHMLFQCKRYRDASVSASEMRDFRGAMQGRAEKGLFITTSRFSSPAVQEANRPGAPYIDLMNGEELIDRLRDLQLGVKPVQDYQIDEEWFSSI